MTYESGEMVKILKDWNFNVTFITHGVGSSINEDIVKELKNYGINIISDNSWSLEELSIVRKNFIKENGNKFQIIFDKGAELVYDYIDLGMESTLSDMLLITEQTSWGIYRLKQLKYLPNDIYSISDSILKIVIDNDISVSEGTFSSIFSYTRKLIAGSTILVVGYGPVGMGIANNAKLLGANTIVAEIDPVRAYLAYMKGHRIMDNKQAMPISDIVITATGVENVVTKDDVLNSKKAVYL
jgi:adenosylhomocysteinase